MQTWCYGWDLLGPPLFVFTDSDGLLKLKFVFVALPTGYGVFTHHQQHYQHLSPPPRPPPLPPNCPFILFSSFSPPFRIFLFRKICHRPKVIERIAIWCTQAAKICSLILSKYEVGCWRLVVVVVGCTAVGSCWKMGLQISHGTTGLVFEDAIAYSI